MSEHRICTACDYVGPGDAFCPECSHQFFNGRLEQWDITEICEVCCTCPEPANPNQLVLVQETG